MFPNQKIAGAKYFWSFLKIALEPVCCKKAKKKFLTSYWFVE